uniref:Uncharacterized protein n=1 Tax=Manihot esculenta TaxID=3983 RepID=A0A199UCE7_MANES
MVSIVFLWLKECWIGLNQLSSCFFALFLSASDDRVLLMMGRCFGGCVASRVDGIMVWVVGSRF